jgi:hypothetical protein
MTMDGRGGEVTWWRRARSRRVTGALAIGAMASGLVLAAAGPAWADSSSSSSTSAPSGQSDLGGWTTNASAAGMSVFYEQPNFPIPANPTLEFNLGYSTASFNSGPVGESNGSAVWPGSVIAGGGSQLPLLVDPYIEDPTSPIAPNFVGTPFEPVFTAVQQAYASTPIASTLEQNLPDPGNWPVQAPSAYPQGPATASNDNGPFVMRSSADQNSSTASSSVGLVGGPSSQSALPAGMLSVQAVGSNVSDTVDSTGNAVSTATSTVHGVDFAGGLIHVGQVTSTATSTSDGNQAKVTGSSSVVGLTVAGEAVTVDSSGVHAAGSNQNVLGPVLPSVNQVLSTAGITVALTNAADTVQGANGQRALHGLTITIDLSQFDQNLATLISMLPSQLTSSLSHLPGWPPYKQSVTIDLGWVTVSSAASPPFTLSLGNLDNGAGNSALSGLSPTEGSTFTPSTTGTTTPSPTSALPVVPSSGSAAPRTALALFKGVGTGLIVLGAILAALLVGLLMGTDRAVGRLAATVPCVGEDTGDLI